MKVPTRVKIYSLLLMHMFVLINTSLLLSSAYPLVSVKEPLPTLTADEVQPHSLQPLSTSPPKEAQRHLNLTVEPAQTKMDSPPETARTMVRQQDLNMYVLNALSTYTGSHYPYLLDNNYTAYNGVTRDIYYQGQLLLKAHPSGSRASHCVGITFEVFVKAMRARNQEAGLQPDDFNGMNWTAMTDFMLRWYVAGPKDTHNLAVAIEKYGLGQRISNLSSVKAGDFIDFTRTNGTGHAVIFINWIKREGEIIGLRYWSSQESTGGISYAEEYFYPHGNVRRDQLLIGRVGPIANYR